MSNSANSPTTTPNESTDLVPESIREQRGLINQNFENLANKVKPYAPLISTDPIVPVDSNRVPVDTNRETWNKTLNRLRFKLLPLLEEQIDTLLELLHPSELEDDIDGSSLALIIEIQSELDQNLHEILSIAAGIKHKPFSSPAQADDQELEEFKEFRRQGISSGLKTLNRTLHSLFDESSHMIRDLTKPSTLTIESYQHLQSSRSSAISQHTFMAARYMNQVIKRMSAHEFTLILQLWAPQVHFTHNEFLSDLPKLIYRVIHHPEREYSYDGLAKCLKNKHALPLAQALIPLMKLSRVFFKTLMKCGLNKIPSKPFTHMNSYQLATLSDSVGFIMHDLFIVMKSIAEYGSDDVDDDQDYNPEYIEGIITRTIRRFDSNILLVIAYVIPLITDSIFEPNPLQTYLLQWNNLFLIAARRCILAAQFYSSASQAAETHENE
ncbi:hypothetical protein PCASD_17042 [Puccinia coronata f. sp. avenae]|uniref:Uncharacterized protein n=1 Tax=Puccinia coronata f. sp. avenae TaxID=200324 RepID=A0A2N5U1L4_9BASI|nr:hypothetical protein PCASD_17042 [Puccinia coronata f. sp. avenae]